jgi:hypothetical protein
MIATPQWNRTTPASFVSSSLLCSLIVCFFFLPFFFVFSSSLSWAGVQCPWSSNCSSLRCFSVEVLLIRTSHRGRTEQQQRKRTLKRGTNPFNNGEMQDQRWDRCVVGASAVPAEIKNCLVQCSGLHLPTGFQRRQSAGTQQYSSLLRSSGFICTCNGSNFSNSTVGFDALCLWHWQALLCSCPLSSVLPLSRHLLAETVCHSIAIVQCPHRRRGRPSHPQRLYLPLL